MTAPFPVPQAASGGPWADPVFLIESTGAILLAAAPVAALIFAWRSRPLSFRAGMNGIATHWAALVLGGILAGKSLAGGGLFADGTITPVVAHPGLAALIAAITGAIVAECGRALAMVLSFPFAGRGRGMAFSVALGAIFLDIAGPVIALTDGALLRLAWHQDRIASLLAEAGERRAARIGRVLNLETLPALLDVVERLAILPCHLVLALIVREALVQQRPGLLALAIGIHAFAVLGPAGGSSGAWHPLFAAIWGALAFGAALAVLARQHQDPESSR